MFLIIHQQVTSYRTEFLFTVATYEVLLGQLDRYPNDLQNDVSFLADFSRQNRNVDLSGRIILNDKDEPTINFGKYKGQTVEQVLKRDPGYYGWIMDNDFPENTKQHFTRLRLEYSKLSNNKIN